MLGHERPDRFDFLGLGIIAKLEEVSVSLEILDRAFEGTLDK